MKALCKYTTLYKIVEYSWRRKPKAIYSYGCSPETTAPQILGVVVVAMQKIKVFEPQSS